MQKSAIKSEAVVQLRAVRPSTTAGFIPKKFDAGKAPGLKIDRFYTEAGEDVWGTVEWEKRSAIITGEKGDVVFEQRDIDVPRTWTQLATNVVASKYFRGHMGSLDREKSVRQLIQRVSYTIAEWGKAMGYFASDADADAFRDELTHLLLHQKPLHALSGIDFTGIDIALGVGQVAESDRICVDESRAVGTTKDYNGAEVIAHLVESSTCRSVDCGRSGGGYRLTGGLRNGARGALEGERGGRYVGREGEITSGLKRQRAAGDDVSCKRDTPGRGRDGECTA